MSYWLALGNTWGVDPDGTECVGCGPQGNFYGCADISITEDGVPPATDPPATNPPGGSNKLLAIIYMNYLTSVDTSHYPCNVHSTSNRRRMLLRLMQLTEKCQ